MSEQHQRIVITQQDIARMVEELQALESAASVLRQNIAVLSASISELKVAIDFMKLIDSNVASTDAYASIGGGAFVRVAIRDCSKVLFLLGAGYVVEVDRESAISLIERRVKELEDVKSSAESRLSEILRRAENIRQLLTYIYSLMRSERENSKKQ